MSDKPALEKGIDYRFDHYGLTALSENGLAALTAAMLQPVYPFTLMVFETNSRVTFSDRTLPVQEAERILHQAGSRV